MTTDLERQFFDTFGIEPRHKCTDGALEPCDEQCNYCGYYELRYPQITDRILLELICILCQRDYELGCCWFAISNNVEELKNYLLGDCIEWANDIKQQVQALFKE